jgi:hypothetical protein
MMVWSLFAVFYIRGPENDDRNHPARKVFDHVFAMEVTWK